MKRCLIALGLVLIMLSSAGCGKKANKAGNKYGKYILHNIYYDLVDTKKAKVNADDAITALQNTENICLIGLWAYNPPAILSAVDQAGKLGQIKIVAFDEHENTLLGIKAGHIEGTVVQDPYRFGYESVKLLAALARGDNSLVPKDGKHHIDYRVITKENVDDFHANLKKLLRAKPAAGKGKGDKVGFVSNNAAEFWTIAEAGTVEAAREFKVDVEFRRPQKGTAAEQKVLIDGLLNQEVKAIAVSVNDPKNQHDYLNEIAAKVPLITQDNDAPQSKRLCYIGTDNYEAGKAVGRLVKKALPDGGTIAIFVGRSEALNAQERTQGVLDELAGEKNAQGKE